MKKIFLSLIFGVSLFNAIARDGTPAGTPNTPTKQYWFYIFKTGVTAANSKKAIVLNDSSNMHIYYKDVYADSLIVSGTNTHLFGFDTLTKKIGIIRKSGLGLGEANTASNLGSGAGLYKQKSSVDLQFKSILGTSNQIIITPNTNDVTLSLPARSENSTSRSLVTSTSSTGFQPNANYDMQVTYSVYAQVASVLVGTNTADVYLEIAATNSSTPSDWTTKSRSGISITGIVSTPGNTQTVSCFVPKGYYVRIRTVATGSNSGSAVFTYQVGQENSY